MRVSLKERGHWASLPPILLVSLPSHPRLLIPLTLVTECGHVSVVLVGLR